MYYLLDDNGNVKPFDARTETGLVHWARTIDQQRRIALDELPNGYKVSTVFMGMDHGFEDGQPIIFETMIFGPIYETNYRTGEWNEYQTRCCTLAQAKEMHNAAVEVAKTHESVDKS